MIPVEFLIDKLGVDIVVEYSTPNVVIRITDTKKNKKLVNMINTKEFEVQQMMGYLLYGETKIEIIAHHISMMLCRMYPHLCKLDIDYTYLNKYKK